MALARSPNSHRPNDWPQHHNKTTRHHSRVYVQSCINQLTVKHYNDSALNSDNDKCNTIHANGNWFNTTQDSVTVTSCLTRLLKINNRHKDFTAWSLRWTSIIIHDSSSQSLYIMDYTGWRQNGALQRFWKIRDWIAWKFCDHAYSLIIVWWRHSFINFRSVFL